MTETVVERVRLLGGGCCTRRASTLSCLEQAWRKAKAAGAGPLGLNPTIAAGLAAEDQV